MRTQRRLSDSEREERRERDRERLKQAAEQLLTSEGCGAMSAAFWRSKAISSLRRVSLFSRSEVDRV
jgi:hypothetical protein